MSTIPITVRVDVTNRITEGEPMAGGHTPPTPHDAEEQLRPLVGKTWAASEARAKRGEEPTEEAKAYRELADAALAMLGTRR